MSEGNINLATFHRTGNVLSNALEVIKKFDAFTESHTLTVYQEETEKAWHNYQAAYALLESTLSGAKDDDLKKYLSDYSAMHNNYLTARIKLSRTAALIAPTGITHDTSISNDTSAITHEFKPNITLPPLRIPHFDGKIDDWADFRSTCASVLVEKMPEVQRLHYLKDALKGEARELVKHLPPVEGSYETAWIILKTRYDNTRVIVNTAFTRFFDLPSIKTESLDALKHMHITTCSMLATLKCFKIDVSTWDPILVYILVRKLDIESLKHWEELLKGSKGLPELTRFYEFLEMRVSILNNTELMAQSNSQSSLSKAIVLKQQKPSSRAQPVMLTLNTNFRCFMCEENHIIVRCGKLLHANQVERMKMINDKQLCRNCLNRHKTEDCPYSSNCKHCTENHHSLLHDMKNEVVATMFDTCSETNSLTEEPEQIEQVFHTQTSRNAILATALFPITHNGKTITVRALIDQGSTSNLITKRLCKLLNVSTTTTYVPLTGPCDVKVGSIKEKTVITMGSHFDKHFQLTITAYIVKTVTGLKPVQIARLKDWPHLQGLPLADQKFLEFNQIDMLLGSIVFAEIVQNGLVKGQRDEPIAQLTSLGWIVSGAANKVEEKEITCNVMLEEESIAQQLTSFWQLEEISNEHYLTVDEQCAEDIFSNSLQRCADGRFMVDLPFKQNPFSSNCFGESYSIAKRRYECIQRRFTKEPELKIEYDQVLQEYVVLGHMKKATEYDKPFVCLPHHPVIKESSTTTKVRVVFDASAKTTNGYSVNNRLYVGPTIQPDLLELLIQWRRFEYAFSGDIEKMYRQVWVHPNHANFQCILWQPPGESVIQRYKLQTVTFGTASAPFQAIRALHQIGNEIKASEPEVAENIQQNFYVDDFLGCEKTLDEAKLMRCKLTEILAEYGFNLRKWKSNHDEILSDIPNEDKENILNIESTFKTLGISWQPTNDQFIFNSSNLPVPKTWTKRAVLSEIAKLFDPLGWMAPFVIKAKILLQNIWKEKETLDWDTPLTHELLDQWTPIFEQMSNQIPIKIPRWIGLSNEVKAVEIHGFSDASMAAYGAAIYLRIIYNNGTIVCNLIAAKTKVAPIKPIVSIPRLELCGAQLLAKLYLRITKALHINDFSVHAWTDSQVVLSWLAAHPSKWSVFVANRTSEIQEILPFQHWLHIPTKQNPADITSRGMCMNELKDSSLWWHGPQFLMQSGSDWNKTINILDENEIPEHKRAIHVVNTNENETLMRHSDYNKLLRFTALIEKWHDKSKGENVTFKTPLSATNMNRAEMRWIKIVQRDHFQSELKLLKGRKEVSAQSLLSKLNPFLDENGLIRMNGRVNNNDIEKQKTAIILPAESHFTKLLIRSVHSNALHGGVQLTLRALRECFWIIHARNAVKSIIHKCIICIRFNKSLLKQKMAELPCIRTQPARPFAFTGCDYAGYFEIKLSERRNAPYVKGYIALFICLTTKAIHLELVCSLTTSEFIMAFENFIARRGIPDEFHSDNGTTFIGAAKEIKRLHDQWFTQNNEITKFFADKRIRFKTIPARASHMGGIWERSVGLVKSHLYRVLKDVKLTTRHFDHLLKQIEACVNSRPLWAMSSEADDIEVLTPSHFYNFQSITTLPKPDVSHLPLNRLDQYQYLYRLYTDFWNSWTREYLHQLQPRSKWTSTKTNVSLGQVVIIADDNLPPSHWKLGKIVAVYPGKDQLVRTVDVRSNGTVLKRPIHKLVVLPVADEGEDVENQQ